MVAGRCYQRYWPASSADPARATAGLLVRTHRQSATGIDWRGSRLPRRAFHRHRHDFRANPFGRKSGRRADRCFLCNQTSAGKQVGESAAGVFRAYSKHCLEHAASPWDAERRICPVERVSVALVCSALRHVEQSDADYWGGDSKRTCLEGISKPLRQCTCRGCGAGRCLATSIGSMRATPGERRVCALPSTDRIASRRLMPAAKLGGQRARALPWRRR